MRFRGVAKLGIALGSGPRDLGFESRHSDQEIHRFCSLKAAKTVDSFCIRLKVNQINRPPVWVRYTEKSAFDPDMTQTGVVLRTVENMCGLKCSENSVYQKGSRCCPGTGILGL